MPLAFLNAVNAPRSTTLRLTEKNLLKSSDFFVVVFTGTSNTLHINSTKEEVVGKYSYENGLREVFKSASK